MGLADVLGVIGALIGVAGLLVALWGLKVALDQVRDASRIARVHGEIGLVSALLFTELAGRKDEQLVKHYVALLESLAAQLGGQDAITQLGTVLENARS